MNHPAPDGKLRMLVVDDHADAADSLRILLELAGHDARVAYGSAAALELARDFQPRVIFTDIQMPGMHGAELAKTLRQLPGLADAIIVAATATDRSDARLKGNDGLFDAWLRKPFGWAAVESLLTRFASRVRR
jgi:CheY-like chemotaxis protein